MCILKELNLCLLLGSAVLCNVSNDDCTKITLVNTWRFLPYPPNILHQALAVVSQVDVEHILPTTTGEWKLSFDFYQSEKYAGRIYLQGGGKSGDKVRFYCTGPNSAWLPAHWATDSTLVTSPRHIGMQASNVSLMIYERVDDKKKLINQHTCINGVPIPLDEVKVKCYSGSCGELQQCVMRAPEATTSPKSIASSACPTSKDQIVVWILVAVLLAAIIGGVAVAVVALRYRKRAMWAAQSQSQSQFQFQAQGQSEGQSQQDVDYEEGLYLQPRSYPQQDFSPIPTIPRAQATEEVDAEAIYSEPYTF